MIKRVERDDIKICVQVIRKSFETVVQEFNLTKENCPGHTSFNLPFTVGFMEIKL